MKTEELSKNLEISSLSVFRMYIILNLILKRKLPSHWLSILCCFRERLVFVQRLLVNVAYVPFSTVFFNQLVRRPLHFLTGSEFVKVTSSL